MKKILFAVLALPVASAMAHADIQIINHPGNVFGDENVLYNEGPLADNGPLVQGITNQSDSIVDFYNAGENIFTPSKGQARISAVDGGLDALSMKMDDPNLGFTSIILNLNASANGQVTFNIHPVGELTFTQTFDINKNGQNFFRILTSNNEVISFADFTTTVNLQDVRQVRVGTAPVPEPASIAALGIGAVGLIRRRRQSKKA